MSIDIIDYGVCNASSVQNMLTRIGYPCKIINSPNEITSNSKLILPGIGSFDNGIKNLEKFLWIDYFKNYFDYETSMSVNWNNKLARRVLLVIMKLFNRPSILNINTNGIAIWTYDDLKNGTYYKMPIIFNEIILRDEYLDTKNNLLFLTVCYHLELKDIYINSLNNYHNYISYDSNKKMLCVK